jgi:hypothetical protein
MFNKLEARVLSEYKRSRAAPGGSLVISDSLLQFKNSQNHGANQKLECLPSKTYNH